MGEICAVVVVLAASSVESRLVADDFDLQPTAAIANGATQMTAANAVWRMRIWISGRNGSRGIR